MDTAETITAQARLLLVLNGAGFFVWQAGEGLARSPQIPEAVTGPALVASGMGFGLWLVALILVFGQTWRAKKLGVYDILSDEWALAARRKAAEAAFWILSLGVVASMTAANFAVDAQLLLRILTGLAVSAFLFAYVWYDSRHEGGA